MKTEETVTYTDDEISLVDVWHFLQRQRKVILIVFSVITAISFSYAITRPTQYIFQRTISIGYIDGITPIESYEQIAYRYSTTQQKKSLQNVPIIEIKQIKNTRYIEIKSTSEKIEIAENSLKKVTSDLLQTHDEIINNKEHALADTLNKVTESSTKNEVSELVKLVSKSINTTKSIQLLEQSADVEAYSGKFIKIFGIGTVAGIFLALILAGLIDYIQRFKANYTRQSTSLLPTQSTIKKVL